jgi:hypothetical protein
MTARQILVSGRLVGLAGALSAIALYAVFVYFNLYLFSLYPAGPWVMWYVIVGLMVALALVAAWASLNAKVLVLLLAFIFSWASVPYGLYVMADVFIWIVFANLLYLVAALLLVGAKVSADGARSGEQQS